MKYAFKRAYARFLNPDAGKFISEQWARSLEDPANFEPGPNGEVPIGYTGVAETVPVNFDWNFTLVGTVLRCKFTNLTENRVIYDFKLDTAHFAEAAAQTLWYIKDDFIKQNYSINNIPPAPADSTSEITSGFLEHSVRLSDLVNAYADTMVSRSRKFLGNESLFGIFVHKSNPTPDDITIVVFKPQTMAEQLDPNVPDTADSKDNNIVFTEEVCKNLENWADHGLTVTGDLVPLQAEQLMKINDVMSDITVTGHTISGDIITVNFTTEDDVDFIYLEQNVGYLPKTKIPVVNKTGSFKIVTTGLDSGDIVLVKIGFRFWVNRTTFTLQLA